MSLKTHHCSPSALMISISSWGLKPIRAGTQTEYRPRPQNSLPPCRGK